MATALVLGRAGHTVHDVTLLGHTSTQIALALENARAYEEVTDRNARLIDEKQYLERELHNEFAEIIGTSVALRRVLKAVKTVAATDSTVLILGETGTGKELVAHAIHNLSNRRSRTFVRMSAAAMSSPDESPAAGHSRRRIDTGRCSTPTTPPSDNQTSCSTTFRSSRTFPGQR